MAAASVYIKICAAPNPSVCLCKRVSIFLQIAAFLGSRKKVTDKMQGFAGVKQIINWLNLFLNFFVCRMQT
jgi:hypothetical protein